MRAPIPDRFFAIFERHLGGLSPIKYDHHPGTETPHLFTFQVEGPQPISWKAGAYVHKSFSINVTDLRVLMDTHGLMRIQSNDPNRITLYFDARA